MDMLQTFNSLEMFIWLIIGIAFLASSFRRSNRYKKLTLFTSLTFIAFGLSDGVEVSTGTWWQPWWLLLWKALCVVIFVICLTYYYWNERQSKTRSNPHN
jgi:hypothetical protein